LLKETVLAFELITDYESDVLLLKETVLAFELITDYESDVLPIVPCCPD